MRGNGGIWWLTKSRVTASPRPSRGGDVPGGIRDAGCWGDRRTKKLGLKFRVLILKALRFGVQKYALSHLKALLIFIKLREFR